MIVRYFYRGTKREEFMPSHLLLWTVDKNGSSDKEKKTKSEGE